MKTLRNYEVADALRLAGTGVPAGVGDQVKMYLDVDANNDFPEFVIGVIQHPIKKVNCDAYTSYSIEYDETDLDGSAELLRAQDIIDAVLTVQADIIAAALDFETARAIAAELVLTNNLNAEVAARILDVNAEESRALSAELILRNNLASEVAARILDVNTEETRALDAELAIATNLSNETAARILDVNTEELRALATEALLAPRASPTFTGAPLAPTAAVDTSTTQLATTAFVVNQAYAKLASPALTGVPVAPTAPYAASTAQLATTAFAKSLISNGFAATPQFLAGVGAVDVVSLSTVLTSTGAVTLVDGQVGQIKTIVKSVAGNVVLTPTTRTGFATVTFNAAGDTVTLQFFATIGWVILGLRGATTP